MSLAIVTGAASGMGRLIAERNLAAGRAVAGLDVNGGGLKELASNHDRFHAFEVDIADTAAVDSAISHAVADQGPPQLVYTAAALGHTGRIADSPAERVNKLMAINYGGTVNTIAAALPSMLEAKAGRFVIFASLAGWVPAKSTGPYSATKAAVVRYSDILRQELKGTGIALTCVCPPAVDTPLLGDMPAAHEGLKYVPAMKPEEVVDAIDRAVASNKPWVFPGRGTRLMWSWSRHSPRLLWRIVNRILPNS